MKKIKGNALSQYGVIILLIGLALVPVFAYTGYSIVNSFQGFSNTLKDSSNSDYNPVASLVPLINSVDFLVTNNPDNSVTVSIGNKKTTISENDIKLAEETMGVNGKEELVKEIEYLMSQYQAQNPNSEMPELDIRYGTGDRSKNMETYIASHHATHAKTKDLENDYGQYGNLRDTSTSTYSGDATALNTTTIKMGDTYVIKQTDKKCNGQKCNSKEIGNYRIEGKLDSSGIFKGNVTSDVNISGVYTANLSTKDDGSTYLAGYFDPSTSNVERISSRQVVVTDYDWNFDFQP